MQLVPRKDNSFLIAFLSQLLIKVFSRDYYLILLSSFYLYTLFLYLIHKFWHLPEPHLLVPLHVFCRWYHSHHGVSNETLLWAVMAWHTSAVFLNSQMTTTCTLNSLTFYALQRTLHISCVDTPSEWFGSCGYGLVYLCSWIQSKVIDSARLNEKDID